MACYIVQGVSVIYYWLMHSHEKNFLKSSNILMDAHLCSLTSLLVSFFRSLVMTIPNLRFCVLIVL